MYLYAVLYIHGCVIHPVYHNVCNCVCSAFLCLYIFLTMTHSSSGPLPDFLAPNRLPKFYNYWTIFCGKLIFHLTDYLKRLYTGEKIWIATIFVSHDFFKRFFFLFFFNFVLCFSCVLLVLISQLKNAGAFAS